MDNFSIKGRHWHKSGNDHIVCDICPRACKLKKGQRGLCFIRQSNGQSIILTSYGKSSGFCIDPIEKKPLNHFLPGTPALSFGTAGCNLSCKFCQNWDISKARDMNTLTSPASPENIARVALEYQCRSVAFTYNDPVIFLEYAVDTALACHEKKLKTVAVSAGYMTDNSRPDFYEHIDAANIDLKAFSENFYKKTCGGHLQDILETLRFLKHETTVWFEITTLLIPDENDSDRELNSMCEWIVENLGTEIPHHFTAFHPDYKMSNKAHTPPKTLLRAYTIARSKGMKFVYIGNIHDEDHDSTYCPECNEKIIGRDWYRLTRWALNNQGRCGFCNAEIAGIFEPTPGNWGPNRQPLHPSLFLS